MTPISSTKPLACLALCFALGHALIAQTPAAKSSGPNATNEILESALARRATPDYTPDPGVTIPAGPTAQSWDSVRQNFRVPDWLQDGKFGIFMHWGVYTVPAYHNEWYPKHMYNNGGIIQWHREHFGPQDKFGYKDFIPLFKAEKFDPAAWAALFKQAGATFVIPTAEHHDRFAMWDSKLTKWNAKNMGPKRDIIGELATAVRAQGMKYGVSNHRMFGYDFMTPSDKNLKTDLYDPAYADFYGPLATEQKTLPTQEFCNDWLARTIELIELYKPDFLWFDWDGTGAENPVKLQFAAYYFNRARQWGKQVAFSQKGDTFPPGVGISSHEKGGRMPKEITPNVWMVDDVISDRSWSYVENPKPMGYRNATSIVHELCEAVSKNGTMMLNISPRSDGTIPQEQQNILQSVGRWLAQNGEAIYGTRHWTQFSDGASVRFTTKGATLYAICLKWPASPLTLDALADGKAGRVKSVSLLGREKPLAFTQDSTGLKIDMPPEKTGEHAWVLKIDGALAPAATAILTPKPAATPRINGPKIFGARPGSPFLYSIPATGERPMTFSAENLPDGLQLDAATGRITGALEMPGEFTVTLRATNARGTAEKSFRIVAGEEIALTPPMGWNSYNCFGERITQDLALRAARQIIKLGLDRHGWTYVNMDDGWQGRRNGPGTPLQANPDRFTDIKAMVDEIHAMGLKAGLYSSPWVVTYGGMLGGSAENPEGVSEKWPQAPKNQKKLPFAIGKHRFTYVDAQQFANWGFDYLKYDWGPVEAPETKEMHQALRASGRDIVLSLSNNHIKNLFPIAGEVAPWAQAWRTTTDIRDVWGRVANDIGFAQEKWAAHARPGHYNDADMLVVGWIGGWTANNLHPTKLTPDEQYTHISLWCLIASPLLIGCDLEKMDDFTLGLLTNDEVLEINQDSLCKQAVQIGGAGDLKIYAKPLDDGTLAVGLFNAGATAQQITASWSDLKLTGRQRVRDLWRQQDIGVFEGKFETTVAPHGVSLVRLFPMP